AWLDEVLRDLSEIVLPPEALELAIAPQGEGPVPEIAMIGDLVDRAARRLFRDRARAHPADAQRFGRADGLGEADDGPVAGGIDRRPDAQTCRSGRHVLGNGTGARAHDARGLSGAPRIEAEREVAEPRRFFIAGA